MVLGYLVVSNEQLFFSAIPQFLIVIPLVATFYICPIAAIVVVRSEVDEHLLMRLTLILLEFVLSAVQLFVWLPSVQ